LTLCFLLLLCGNSFSRKVRIFGTDDVIFAPNNICQYMAADSDMNNAGIAPAISSECNKLLGQTPDAVHVNADSNPYKMCLVPENATFSGLKPATAQKIIAKDTFNNTSNQNVSHTFGLTGSFSESLEMSTSTTVSLSITVSYSVTIPDMFSSSFSMDTTFSTTSTTTHTASNTISYDPSTTVDCEPSCFYTATETVNTYIYESDMVVDICLSGYARCEYESRVNGHYYWYVLVDDFIAPGNRCFVQDGTLNALTADISSSTTLSKACYKP